MVSIKKKKKGKRKFKQTKIEFNYNLREIKERNTIFGQNRTLNEFN